VDAILIPNYISENKRFISLIGMIKGLSILRYVVNYTNEIWDKREVAVAKKSWTINLA